MKQERERGRKSCVGLLLAEYVRKTKKTTGVRGGRISSGPSAGSGSGGKIELLKEVTVAEPTCLGFSWKSPPEKSESKLNTLDKLDVVGPEEGIPLRLKYMCYGICRHNAGEQSGEASKVELPQCGGMEVLIQSVVADRRERSTASESLTSSSGRMSHEESTATATATAASASATGQSKPVGKAADASRQRRSLGPREREHGNSEEDVRTKELRAFCNNFMTVSGRIVKKMGENGGLVAGVFEKTLREVNDGIRKALFGEDKK